MGPLYVANIRYPVPTADPVVLRVGSGPRGVIRTLRLLSVVPSGGSAPGSFSFAAYCSLNAFVLDDSGNPTAVLAADSELYRITPAIVTTGAAVEVGGFGLAYYFQNLDATINLRGSSIYLLASGVGTTNALAVSIAVEGPTPP